MPTASPDDLVSETLDGMRGKHFETAVAVAVLDNDRLLGVAIIERCSTRRRTPHFVMS